MILSLAVVTHFTEVLWETVTLSEERKLWSVCITCSTRVSAVSFTELNENAVNVQCSMWFYLNRSDLIMYKENILTSKCQNCILNIIMTVESELLLSHSENWDEMRNESSILQSESNEDWVVQNQDSFLKLVYIQTTEEDTVTDITVQRDRRQKKISI